MPLTSFLCFCSRSTADQPVMEGTRQTRICRPHKISESSKVCTFTCCLQKKKASYRNNQEGGKGSPLGWTGLEECEYSGLLRQGLKTVVYLPRYF